MTRLIKSYRHNANKWKIIGYYFEIIEYYFELPIIITYVFYKQRVHKQLALGWRIVKQLSELNPLSLSNNKNYGLKESGNFPLRQT